MKILSKIQGSSTFWVSLLLPALNLVSTAFGYPIPWDVVAVAVGGYAAKEAAGKIRPPQP
jgi:hypothetical protein